MQSWASTLAGGGDPLEALLLTLGVSAADLRRIIDQGLALSGGGAGGISRSVQVARSITEIQANEVVAYLEDIALTARAILAAVTGTADVAALGRLGARAPAVAAPAVMGAAGTAAAQRVISIGELNVERGVLSEDDIEDLLDRLGQELRRRSPTIFN